MKEQALEESVLRGFNDALIHRGPDGSGVKIFGNGLGLAQRRLAILDVTEAGAQPMTHISGRFHISYNGEVFNFLELKKELESLGHSFSSDSDTEVILAAYSVWGKDCFHRFNGMWAIAIYDEVEQELLLCRDRFGIKPLYYLQDTSRFAFASETNAFKSLEGYDRQVDQRNLDIALADTYALEGKGHSIYKDIYQLLPGHLMHVRKAKASEQYRWYNIRQRKVEVPASYEAQVEEFRALFRDACAIRMRSDVSLATALSGGVDSTAVYSMVHELMQEQGAQRVPQDWQKAFVAVFPGTVQDETTYAQAAVAHTGGEAVYLDPAQDDLLSALIESTTRFDAISATPILALMTVYQGMRKAGVTVSLDGHGVDEMLYGYRKMVYDAFEFHKWHGDREQAKSIAQVLTGLYAPQLRSTKERDLLESIVQAGKQRESWFYAAKQVLKKLRSRPEDLQVTDLLTSMSADPYDFSSLNTLDRLVYEEFFIRTLPSLLRNFDKAAMMHSVEIRMPFMDYRLVEYAFSLPLEAKLGGGYTKRILRDAMEGIMPEENRVRTFKVGLAAPTMEWFQGPLRSWLNDTVHSADFQQSSYWDSSVSRDILVKANSQQWTTASAAEAWKYLNAHLILHG